MPKPNQTINEREAAICHRVNFARKEIIKWSQPDLARELGITQNQLAGIEYGRSPLRYREAMKLCNRFDISQRWLADGVLPFKPVYDTWEGYSVLVKSTSLFSWVFAGYMEGRTAAIESNRIAMVGEVDFRAGNFKSAFLANLPPEKLLSFEIVDHSNLKSINMRYQWLPEDLRHLYLAALAKASSQFWRKNFEQIKRLPSPAQCPEAESQQTDAEKVLTQDSLKGNTIPVKPQLPSLIEKVKRKASKPGSRAELARLLGVAPARITEWLAGQKEPGGEYTLQLQKWVE